MIILPSLEIVPAKYNGNILLSQIPVNGTGDFTVSRALNTATRVNSLGNIELVNADTPRIDYLTSSGTVGCPALLVEPSGQNLVQRSEEFENAYWTKTSTTASGNITTSPDGTLTADKIIENANTDLHYVRRTFALSGTYAISVYAKAAERDRIWVGSVSTGRYTIFDLTNGTVVTQVGISDSQITKLKDGWYRCAVIDTINLTAFLSYGIVSGTSRTYSGDGTSGVFLWGAQLETGSVATSYIPTTTAAVTRNADLISVSGAVSGSIGQTEGTIYAEVDLSKTLGSTGRNIIWLSDGNSINDSVGITIGGALGSNNLGARIWDGSVNRFVQVATAPQGIFKIAFAYQSNNCALYVNGNSFGTVTTNLTFTLSGMNVVQVGSFLTGTDGINDRIRAAALYTTRLTDTQLALLTSPYTSYSSMASALSYTLG